MVPDQDLVVVRLGQTSPSSDWEMRPLVEGIIEALTLTRREPAP